MFLYGISNARVDKSRLLLDVVQVGNIVLKLFILGFNIEGREIYLVWCHGW